MSDTALSTFEIHVPDPNVTDASVALSWCARPEFFAELDRHHVDKPYVYIVVVPEGSLDRTLERRYAFPLQDAMGYVSFARPGKNTVLGFVVSKASVDNFLMPDTRWRWNVPCVEREMQTHAIRIWKPGWPHFIWLAEPLEVMVPETVFAPPPPAWLKRWVDWGYSGKLPAIDSCEFERRVIFFSAHIQVLWFIATMLLRVLFYVGCKLMLMRGISIAPIVSPFLYNTDDIWDSVIGPRFWPTHVIEDGKDVWSWWYMFATPLCMVCYTISFVGSSVPYPLVFGVGLALAHAVLLTLGRAVYVGAVAVLRWWQSPETWDARSEARNRQEQEARDRASYWYRDPEAIEPIVCTPEAPRKPLTSSRDLPPERVPVTLVEAEIKAATCRPFAAQ